MFRDWETERTEKRTRRLRSPAYYWRWGAGVATAFWLTMLVLWIALAATGH